MHKQIFNPVRRELEMVEGNLNQNIDSGVDVLNQASMHLAKAGGKGLGQLSPYWRPAFFWITWSRLYLWLPPWN